MSRSYSVIGQTPLMCVRVAGELQYIPEHVDATGKKNNAQCNFSVYANGKKRKDGSEGRKDTFRLTAWGKLADACARGLHAGMAIDVLGKLQSYKARVWVVDAAGNRVPMTDAAGQPVMQTKVGLTIEDFQFAEENSKFIAAEITDGRRPQFWNVVGHQHFAAYKQALQAKVANKQMYAPGMQTFGFAKVFVPQGATITAGQTAPVQQAGSLPNQVNAALNPQTIVQNGITYGLVNGQWVPVQGNFNPGPAVNSHVVDPNAALNTGMPAGGPAAPTAPMAAGGQVRY